MFSIVTLGVVAEQGILIKFACGDKLHREFRAGLSISKGRCLRTVPNITEPPGSGIFSQGVSPSVSSALRRFTSVFGMGTGGSTPL